MAGAAKTSLSDRLDELQERIARACDRAKRDRAEVTLVAVTKYAGPEQIRELIKLGVADLGENRVQQLTQRAAQVNEVHSRRLAAGDAEMPAKLRWHMIGRLQRNKVKQLLPAVAMVHSIDSLRLAEEIESVAEKIGKRVPVLVQVNCSEEAQKAGVAVGAAMHLGEQIASMEHLQLMGLMTMAEYGASEEKARFTFARLREIFDDMRFQKIGGASFKHLSMGMSDDFEHAILEGATILRIGSALFGSPQGGEAEEVDED